MTITKSNYARKDNEFYETEPWVVEALLRCIPPVMTKIVWEPAAGNHAIANVLKTRGHKVTTSDIATYDVQHDFCCDFFELEEKVHYQAIITNPPYGKGNRLAARFAEHALNICDGWIALLLTAKFDFAKTRQNLFKNNRRFYGKIALLDRISWTGDGRTGTEDHAWYVWSPSSNMLGLDRPACPILLYQSKVLILEAAE